MLVAAALALALLGGPAHSRSEGRSVFALDDEGRVHLQIWLGDLDLPELCDVDFSLADRAAQERRLTRCLTRDLPVRVRLKADGRPCALAYERFDVDRAIVILSARGDCGAVPRTLSVDWGLFAGSPLDHVNVARFEPPWGEPRVALLSKRAPHVRFEVSLAPQTRALIGALVTGLVAAVVGLLRLVVARARRRRRRS